MRTSHWQEPRSKSSGYGDNLATAVALTLRPVVEANTTYNRRNEKITPPETAAAGPQQARDQIRQEFVPVRYLSNAQEGLDFLCPERRSLANQQLAHSRGFDVTDPLVIYRTERLLG